MADPDARQKLVLWRSASDERDLLEVELMSIQVLAAAQRHEVGRRVDGADVSALAEGDTQTCSLSDCVSGSTSMLADGRAIEVDERAWLLAPAGPCLQRR